MMSELINSDPNSRTARALTGKFKKSPAERSGGYCAFFVSTRPRSPQNPAVAKYFARRFHPISVREVILQPCGQNFPHLVRRIWRGAACGGYQFGGPTGVQPGFSLA